jgi:diadenosine tetraphosphate (Ap4A) HIT family hydrolase
VPQRQQRSQVESTLLVKRGTAYYENLGPAARQQMQRDLADYARAFDAKYGTQLYDSMIRNGFPEP